ncbi:hypothetical protein [Planctomycetes bacterium TBK1r]|uniref:Uncharacterized protein n=1 Tax=Stieleria magnilauensis TaxID=2527963 RepID=A0ABX5Y1W3_9BACT|nr:hypothetical protein TBK1r_62190 [Planctomycetes bacterium TBK1r]
MNLTKLLTKFADEAQSDHRRAQANQDRFNGEILKNCTGKPCDIAFVEQWARENAPDDPAGFIKQAVDRCDKRLRKEAIEAQIAELEAEKSRIWSEIRSHLEAKADAEKRQNAAHVFDRWGEPKAGVGLAEIDAFRDSVRDVARFADREAFARRELAKVEQRIKTLKDQL